MIAKRLGRTAATLSRLSLLRAKTEVELQDSPGRKERPAGGGGENRGLRVVQMGKVWKARWGGAGVFDSNPNSWFHCC